MTEKHPISVTEMQAGETGTVHSFSAGHGVERKLLTMGIVPGHRLRKVSGGRHGPVVVETSGIAIAVGATLASKIMILIDRTAAV